MDVFDQDEVWYDRAGEVFQIDEMSASERYEVTGFLDEHARWFYLQVLRKDLIQWLPTTEAALGVDVPELVFKSAETWMTTTPLYIKLAG